MKQIDPKKRNQIAQNIAVWTMLLVGAYDIAVGITMLFSNTPWNAHGPGTIWSNSADWMPTLGDQASMVVVSLFRRIGAFSLFAGLTSMFVALNFRHDRRNLLRFMLLYMIAGLGFAATDAIFFADTPYYWLKQVIGAAWFIATIILWRAKPRSV